MTTVLFVAYYALILMFGIHLSFSFLGVKFSKSSILAILLIFAGSGVAQLLLLVIWGEDIVWKLYPLIVHVPIAMVLYFKYKNKLTMIMASVSLTYLCCQPAKWFGLLTVALSQSEILDYIIRIIVLAITGIVSFRILAPVISKIYNKDTKTIFIFGGIPIVYYFYDYITAVYTDMWLKNSVLTSEFFPFLLCILIMIFYTVYYREYEKKTLIEHKQQLIANILSQQKKDIEVLENKNAEMKILRHDIRHLLTCVTTSINNGDKDTALSLISEYISMVDSTVIHRHCENDTLNYIISNYENICAANNIQFNVAVAIQNLSVDAMLFSSIVSNALENAINAQKDMPSDKRKIKLTIKTADSKLLLSVKNPFNTAPVFINDMPVTNQHGHGYGTQSIKYITEQLGGKCQFAVQDDLFVLRVII